MTTDHGDNDEEAQLSGNVLRGAELLRASGGVRWPADHVELALVQMQRTREILSPEGEIAHLSEDERRRLLQEETIVVEFEPDRAKRSLPKLLRTPAERRHALSLLERIEMHGDLDDKQRKLVVELRALLSTNAARTGTRTPAALPAPARKARTRAAPRGRAAPA